MDDAITQDFLDQRFNKSYNIVIGHKGDETVAFWHTYVIMDHSNIVKQLLKMENFGNESVTVSPYNLAIRQPYSLKVHIYYYPSNYQIDTVANKVKLSYQVFRKFMCSWMWTEKYYDCNTEQDLNDIFNLIIPNLSIAEE